MFKFHKISLLTVLFINTLASGVNISYHSTFIPSELGNIKLYHNGNGFVIHKEREEIEVKSYDMDPVLRNITQQKLNVLMHSGYISVRKVGDDYALRFNVRGLGGGPVGAVVCATAAKGAVDATAEGIYMGVGWIASWWGGVPASIFAYNTAKAAGCGVQAVVAKTAAVGAGIWGGTWLPF